MIDAHQHFWRYTAAEYGWIPDDAAAIRRDFLPADLAVVRTTHGVRATVAVQARQTLAETRWLLDLAHADRAIAGVVGWVPLADPAVDDHLARFAADGLRGVRHVVQGEPDGFLGGAAFNLGIDAVARRGLAYDLLIHERQLPEAIAFADRHPDLRIVLDHGAKPRIAAREREPWRARIRDLARRPHVVCKLSGLPTEAAPGWTVDDLRPSIADLLEAFGPRRLLFGSDWPVVEASGGYGRWLDAVRACTAALSRDERHALFTGTAVAAYRLELP